MNMSDEGTNISVRFPDLSGKVAIVTGASRGIGRDTVLFLAAQGMRVTTVARSDAARDALVTEVEGLGAECLWVSADTSTLDGAQAVFDATMDRFGGVDLLVGSAADKASRPFLELDDHWYHRSFEANVRIIYGLSRLVALHMVETGRRGSIVHISSVGGLRPHRGTVGYDLSKAAIDHLARAMAIELGPHGIRVNAIAPGFTPTVRQRERKRETLLQKCDGIPMRRPGTGEDVAALVAFLASDAGTYITGQVIYVDGGLTVQLTPSGYNI
jgi:3-oxoacyl-[acyl-carrier protein] reductase